MSENVKVHVQTTSDTKAAEKAARSIDNIGRTANKARGSLDAMEAEASRLEAELRKLPVGSAGFNALIPQLKAARQELQNTEREATRLAGTMGRRGNAGMAVLEFSRAFEDAQYGVRGVLNNIPGLIAMLGGGAGLAGVISLAAVAGTQLWEHFAAGPKAAKKEAEDYLAILDKLRQAALDAEAERSEKRDKDLEEFERSFEDSAGEISDKARKANAENTFEAAVAKANLLYELTSNRIDLQKNEQQMAAATGGEHIKLAERRAVIIERILAAEKGIAAIARQQTEQAAKEKLNAAQQTAAAGAAKVAAIAPEYTKVAARLERTKRSEKMFRDRRVEEAVQQEELVKRMEDGYSPQTDLSGAKAGDINRERAKSQKMALDLNTPSEIEMRAQALREASEKEFDSMKEKLREATDELSELSKMATQASEELASVKNMQTVERLVDTQGNTSQIDQEVGNNMLEAKATLQKIEDPTGQVEESIKRISALANDDIPDGSQAGNLGGILESLTNNLVIKDESIAAGIKELIDISKTQVRLYSGLKTEISGLKSLIGQVNPSPK